MSKKLKIYIDTSVFGGYFDQEFSEYSKNLFHNISKGVYTAVVSDLTLQELENAPIDVLKIYTNIPSSWKIILSITDEAIDLANAYITEGILTPKFYNDALHIALASISNVDLLVSWNFKHIVNYKKILLFNSVNFKKYYPEIEIRSRMELINE